MWLPVVVKTHQTIIMANRSSLHLKDRVPHRVELESSRDRDKRKMQEDNKSKVLMLSSMIKRVNKVLLRLDS